MNGNERGPIIAVVVFILVVLIGYGTYARNEGLAPFGPSDNQWTGVFLTNGQAYFGHYYDAPGDYVQLREVHYLLAAQQDPQSTGQAQAGPGQISLNKLGGEIHGPKSDMRISKQQILFVEELRADSALIAAIVQLKNQPPGVPQASATPAPVRSASPSPASSPSPSRSPSPSASASASPAR